MDPATFLTELKRRKVYRVRGCVRDRGVAADPGSVHSLSHFRGASLGNESV